MAERIIAPRLRAKKFRHSFFAANNSVWPFNFFCFWVVARNNETTWVLTKTCKSETPINWNTLKYKIWNALIALLLERFYQLKTIEHWNDWFNDVQLSNFIQNTSYHSTFGGSPTVRFLGRQPLKTSDLWISNTSIQRIFSEVWICFRITRRIEQKFFRKGTQILGKF